MTILELTGDQLVAFDHLAGYGLAAILDAAHPGRVRLRWTADLDSRLQIDGSTWEQAGETVHAHAVRHTHPDSWVMADGDNNGGRSGLFSPRVKPMDERGVHTWYESRSTVLDRFDRSSESALDQAMIGALGEPSYWSFVRDQVRPDHGASRWEMKTRNRGEEFVAHRLRRLAESVASRAPLTVAQGLARLTVDDEAGKNRPDSRTPTGLMPPARADNARAWCALWGLSLTSVVHTSRGASRTSGHRGRLSEGTFFLPLPTRFVPLARLRTILISSALDSVAGGVPDADRSLDAHWSWLSNFGVDEVVSFPVFRSANVSAPERWAERGDLVRKE